MDYVSLVCRFMDAGCPVSWRYTRGGCGVANEPDRRDNEVERYSRLETVPQLFNGRSANAEVATRNLP